MNGKHQDISFIDTVSKEPEDIEQYAKVHQLKISTETADLLLDPEVEASVLARPHSLHVHK